MKAISFALSALAGLLATCQASYNPELQHPLDPKLSLNSAKERPNIVFILTDDQDLQLDSLSYMPLTTKHLKKGGTFYKNHFVPTAICCPSRVSLWTGRFAHNTNVTDVNPPYG